MHSAAIPCTQLEHDVSSGGQISSNFIRKIPYHRTLVLKFFPAYDPLVNPNSHFELKNIGKKHMIFCFRGKYSLQKYFMPLQVLYFVVPQVLKYFLFKFSLFFNTVIMTKLHLRNNQQQS